MHRWRRWILLRLAAILVGLLPLLVLETGLRILGVAGPDVTGDPFVGFDSVQPLFVQQGERWEIPSGRHEFFRPESFLANKPQRQFRIFCLGGSTVQGRPYQIETSFTTWLQINLNAADRRHRWRVINCGGVSYASYRLVPILNEVLQHQPDLVILYTGHNEFLEDRTYGDVKNMNPIARSLYQTAFRLHTFRFLWQIKNGSVTPKESLPTEVDALLDYQGGLEFYNYDPQWRQSVMDHFVINIDRMMKTCQAASVPMIVIDPLYNLQDSPPFKIAHNPALDANTLATFASKWQQANEPSTPLERRIERLQECVKLDGEHAGVHFQLGKCLHALGKHSQAKAAFLAAKETDICPLRVLEPMRASLRRLAKSRSVPLLPTVAEFERSSRDGILGNQWLVDHVHPSIHGHQVIADLLTQQLADMNIAKLDPQWKELRRPLFQQHLASLGELYSQHAKIRLDGLRQWSKGRGTKLKKQRP